jgi:Icc-related predicted phosphoesterase
MNKSKNNKTRILAVGDIHGDSGLVKRLAQKARKENIDLIILAGDLTLAEMSTKNIVGPFIKEGKTVLLLHGNHESLSTAELLSKKYPNTKNLHEYSFKSDDLGIFGAGGAIGFNTNEKEIFNALKKGNDYLKDIKKKIMVTHMHHKGSKAEFSGFEGSKAITKAIKEFKPDLLINAHIHEAGGIEEKIGKTRIINVSRKPKVIEI